MVPKTLRSELDVLIYQYIGTWISYCNFPYYFRPLTHFISLCKGYSPILLLQSEPSILIEPSTKI